MYGWSQSRDAMAPPVCLHNYKKYCSLVWYPIFSKHSDAKEIPLKYGFCKKFFTNETLGSWTYLSSLLGGFAVVPTQKWWKKCSTAQSFIRKEATSYKICILVSYVVIKRQGFSPGHGQPLFPTPWDVYMHQHFICKHFDIYPDSFYIWKMFLEYKINPYPLLSLGILGIP